MGNFQMGRDDASLTALFGDRRSASRYTIQPERLAGARHA